MWEQEIKGSRFEPRIKATKRGRNHQDKQETKKETLNYAAKSIRTCLFHCCDEDPKFVKRYQ